MAKNSGLMRKIRAEAFRLESSGLTVKNSDGDPKGILPVRHIYTEGGRKQIGFIRESTDKGKIAVHYEM